METNLLKAIVRLVNNPVVELQEHYKSNNRANNAGDSLEAYIGDLFAGSVGENDEARRNSAYSQHFSYIGNQNNPPDYIIRAGDAIEVKKIENMGSSLALNSSYPKDKLYADSPMITSHCRSCEQWDVKDIIYAIGVVKGGKLKALWFVYGDCYAASKDIYERIRSSIADGVNGIAGVEFSETNELGRVNKVDPLGITYLRVRGMWGIKNPKDVFNYITTDLGSGCGLSVNSIMLKGKYDSFPEIDKYAVMDLQSREGFSIGDVRIKSPNNPANMLDAKLISYKVGA